MAAYNTDDEQLEELKKWWQENGRAVIIGVILGLGGVISWGLWADYSINRAETASAIYDQALEALKEKDADKLDGLVAELRADYTATPYAELAILAKVKLAMEKGDLETAETQLRWVRDEANQDEVRHIASLRLAEVLLEKSVYADALAVLEGRFPASFVARAAELRGDIYYAQGELEQARNAYQAAIDASGSTVSKYLEMKLNDLAAPGNS